MFGFGSDDNQKEEEQAESVKLGKSMDEKEDSKSKIHTIPDAFYGGKNPQVYEEKQEAKEKVQERIEEQEEKEEEQEKKEEKEAKEEKSEEKEKEEEPEQPQKEIEEPPEEPTPSSNWVKIASITGGLILILAGISGYYFYQAGYFGFGQQQMAQQQEPQQTEPTDTEPEPQPMDQPEPEPTTTPTTTPKTIPAPTTTEPAETTTPTTTLPEIEETLTFPSILTSDSTDIDSDDLTDEEEEVFGVDSGSWDTDGDGYFDGQEIRNLYHPDQQAPSQLPGSDLVEEYVSPQFGYRVFYPSQWESASVNADGRAVLFNAITGDYILVRAVEKEPGESFNEWFTRKIEDQSRTELTEFENKYNVTGYRRDDDLVAYFPGEEEVYILIYNPGVQDQIPFREVMKLMIQSFRLEDSLQVLPRQNVIPQTQTNRQTTQTTTQTTTPQTTTTTQAATTTQTTTTEEIATTTNNQNTTTQSATTTEEQATTTPTTTVTSS